MARRVCAPRGQECGILSQNSPGLTIDCTHDLSGLHVLIVSRSVVVFVTLPSLTILHQSSPHISDNELVESI